MSIATQTALEQFFHGFGATAAILTLLVGAIYLVYRRSNKSVQVESEVKPLPKWLEDAERMAAGNQATSKEPLSFGAAFRSAMGVLTIALAVAVFIYAWTIGIRPYDGTVERKHSGKGYRLQISVYYIDVQGVTYSIGEGLYKRVKKGDRVRRPFGAPWTYVNGEPFVYAFALTLFGVLFGALAVVAGAVNLLIWLNYRDGVHAHIYAPPKNNSART